MSNPPKLRDLLPEFFERQQLAEQTTFQYRYSVKQLAVSLGYQPTMKDLRECCLEWLANRLTISGLNDKTKRECVRRLRTLLTWSALRRLEGGAQW